MPSASSFDDDGAMTSQPQFKKAFPYQKDVLALPVVDLDEASRWYSAHFGMTDAEFQTEFRRDQHLVTSKALTEYWKHRDAIRKICEPHFKANPIRFTVAVGEVHAYFQKAPTILTNP